MKKFFVVALVVSTDLSTFMDIRLPRDSILQILKQKVRKLLAENSYLCTLKTLVKWARVYILSGSTLWDYFLGKKYEHSEKILSKVKSQRVSKTTYLCDTHFFKNFILKRKLLTKYLIQGTWYETASCAGQEIAGV